MLVGGARHAYDRLDYADSAPTFDNHGDVNHWIPTVIRGQIISTPQIIPVPDSIGRLDRPDKETRCLLQVSFVRSGLKMIPCQSRLQLIVDGEKTLHRGDRLEVFGQWRFPSPPSNPGGFDSQWFSRNQNLHGILRAQRPSDVVVEQRAHWWQTPARWLARFAAFGRSVLVEHCGPDVGSLVVGMVLGQRDSIPASQRDQLLATGTIHLLSVSGLHLAIVVSLVTGIVTVFPIKMSLRIAIILLVGAGYVALTGGRPPVIRAAVLVATLWLGYVMGRPSSSYNALSLAAIALLMFAPRHLFGVGVLLSFVAVVSLIAAGRRLLEINAAAVDAAIDVESKIDDLIAESQSRWQQRLTVLHRTTRSVLWSSLCVTSMTAPLVWYHFHVVSPIAVLVNILLTPLLAISLGSGLATVAAATLSDTLAVVPGCLTWGSTSIMAWLVQSAADIRWGHFWLPSPSAWMVYVFYATLLATVFLPRTSNARRLRIGLVSVWFVIASLTVARPTPLDDGELRMIFVDVGHGTSVVIRRGSRNYLYDCGRLGNDDFHARDIEDVLWDEHITKLDGVILSHADVDHFNALPTLLKRFDIRRIYTPPGMIQEDEIAVKIIRKAIRDSGKRVDEIRDGDRIDDFMQISHPLDVRNGGSDNANSVVLQIHHQDRSIVLPGDLEPPGTERVTNLARPKPGGVLMAPHHGSLRMRADLVLSWARPSIVVVSGSYRAATPEVATMLSQTGAKVFVTSKAGAVRVVVKPNQPMNVRQWESQPW